MAKNKTEPDATPAPAAANDTPQPDAPEAQKPEAPADGAAPAPPAAELPDNCIRMRFPAGTTQIGLPWDNGVVILKAEDDGTIVVPEDAEPQLLLAGLVRV
jgi:hypothetical protein